VRNKLSFLILLQILMLSRMVHSTDLRGGVAGYSSFTNTSGPLPGIQIGLFVKGNNNTFSVVRQAVTGSDGTYYLNGVPPGRYVLQINGVNYPLTVTQMETQDVPIINIQAGLPSAPSSADSGSEAISADEAKQFVRDFFAMLSRNAPTEQLLKAYAQPVKYYRRGTIDHVKLGQILQQIRFPTHKYEVESIDVIKITPREISQGLPTDAVRIRVTFHEKIPTDISEPARQFETWVLRKASGTTQIVECQTTNDRWQILH
jgi:hypothetical protein